MAKKPTKKMRRVHLYTDGSWRDYLGTGGYAGVILDDSSNFIEEVSGIIFPCNSSELAEIIAITETFERLKTYPKSIKQVKVYIDHLCIRDVLEKKFLQKYNTVKWQSTRKIKLKKHILRNLNAWIRLYNAMVGFSVEVVCLLPDEKKLSKWHRRCHKLAGEKSNRDDTDFWM